MIPLIQAHSMTVLPQSHSQLIDTAVLRAARELKNKLREG